MLGHEGDSSMDETFRSYFESSLLDKSLVVWVTEGDGAVVSSVCFCICRLAPHFDNPSGLVAYMANVFTIPSYRRQGIGSKLISEAMGDLKAQGIRKILLHSSDMARPMYESLGFVEGKSYMTMRI
ncbi:GNAT family N-acetyltransferase [Paenibacillus sp. MMS18-CY102]|uniref:GNAT family N-acetyltransferase n=1 Tax=Paenibacillus sp. MMS18-CY102 TaxID=2682849 RepID=UPI001F301CEC|nr:GNAT family N-acetyltransferase [Paenibacillus sp. MMS18-CY102]